MISMFMEGGGGGGGGRLQAVETSGCGVLKDQREEAEGIAVGWRLHSETVWGKKEFSLASIYLGHQPIYLST